MQGTKLGVEYDLKKFKKNFDGGGVQLFASWGS